MVGCVYGIQQQQRISFFSFFHFFCEGVLKMIPYLCVCVCVGVGVWVRARARSFCVLCASVCVHVCFYGHPRALVYACKVSRNSAVWWHTSSAPTSCTSSTSSTSLEQHPIQPHFARTTQQHIYFCFWKTRDSYVRKSHTVTLFLSTFLVVYMHVCQCVYAGRGGRLGVCDGLVS